MAGLGCVLDPPKRRFQKPQDTSPEPLKLFDARVGNARHATADAIFSKSDAGGMANDATTAQRGKRRGNTSGTSNTPHRTYNPVDLA